MKKKGQVTLGNGTSVIISFFILALFVGVLLIAIRGVYTGTASIRDTTTKFEDNSTFLPIRGTPVNFAIVEYSSADIVSCTGVNITNSTGQDKTANFTVTSTCFATWNGDTTQNNTNHKANYTLRYYVNGDKETQLNNTALSVGNISTQFPTLGTILSMALVLGVIVVVFLFKPNSGGAL